MNPGSDNIVDKSFKIAYFTVSGWIKKKIRQTALKRNEISIRHEMALLRFFYKEKQPEDMTIDEYAKYLSELKWLSHIGVIPIKLD